MVVLGEFHQRRHEKENFMKLAPIILLDVEGTTTPISFVYDKLFPYARKHIRWYLTQYCCRAEIRDLLAQLNKENPADLKNGAPAFREKEEDSGYVDSAVAYCLWLMDRDRKTTPLKALQGYIWEEGFARRELQSEVFSDVPKCFAAWRSQGRRIAIFSSGSVAAQKLVFEHTPFGNLTPQIEAFFDTNIGSKRDAQSYTRISEQLHAGPAEILFVSDVPDELDAASTAGMSVALAVRPGNAKHPNASIYSVVNSFSEFANE
jgi:enolase-phosphatase E1